VEGAEACVPAIESEGWLGAGVLLSACECECECDCECDCECSFLEEVEESCFDAVDGGLDVKDDDDVNDDDVNDDDVNDDDVNDDDVNDDDGEGGRFRFSTDGGSVVNLSLFVLRFVGVEEPSPSSSDAEAAFGVVVVVAGFGGRARRCSLPVTVSLVGILILFFLC
jgi:hypothetical protein